MSEPLFSSKPTEAKSILKRTRRHQLIILLLVYEIKSLCSKASQSTKVTLEQGAYMSTELGPGFHSVTKLKSHKVEKPQILV